MISCHSVNRIHNLDFASYLLLPNYSHSFLKHEDNGFAVTKSMTKKMELGSLVDGIRTGGDVNMSSELYPAAKKIAHTLDVEFGWALDMLEKQVSYTGIMRLDLGKAIFEMPVKGRTDYVQPNGFVLDLKVTATPIEKIDANMHFMGYPNQAFCYNKLDGSIITYFLIYSTKSDKAILKKIQTGDTNKFWEEKLLKFGKAI